MSAFGLEVVCDHATIVERPVDDSDRTDLETRLFDAFPTLDKLVLHTSPTRQVSFHPGDISYITYEWEPIDTDTPAES